MKRKRKKLQFNPMNKYIRKESFFVSGESAIIYYKRTLKREERDGI